MAAVAGLGTAATGDLDTPILVLDEPATSADAETQALVIRTIEDRRDAGVRVIVVPIGRP